jgi:UDP-N-acetylglucosamine 2-epimerase (non-hydrolysing)
MKILSVVGARPNFMKIAPIVRAVEKYNSGLSGNTDLAVEHVLVHTGQHYDAAMSDQFFKDLDLAAPDRFLGVGSGSHAQQTGLTMQRFEGVLLEERPDVVLVAGDVNSTVACALVTAKATFNGSNGSHNRAFLGHVEAGLRSFDRTMPEEVNRIVTDHLSDLLFVTEQSGLDNLKREGIPEEKIFLVGNTMVDSLIANREAASRSPILKQLGLGNGDSTYRAYSLLTLHRPSNVDDSEQFRIILEAIGSAQGDMPVIFPVHPRSHRRIEEYGLAHLVQNFSGGIEEVAASEAGKPGVHLIPPVGYLDFVALMSHASLVLTDSGGIQEETTCMGIPCVTIRENTERPVTVSHGTNYIAGISTQGIQEAIKAQIVRKPVSRRIEFWDGQAAQRIIGILLKQVAGVGKSPRVGSPDPPPAVA